jgi:two-component system sensor histidine kinase KdpD
MRVKQIPGPWKSGERLLVAVSASVTAEPLIRWTRRMAYNLEGVWFALHVETSATLPPPAKEQLARNLALVRELGGEVLITRGDDVVAALLQLAKQRNITQIVVGKPGPASWFGWLKGSSLVDRLLRASGGIDVHVVASENNGATANQQPDPWVFNSPGANYVWAVLAVALITALDLLLLPGWGYQVVGLTELFVVFLIAIFLGRCPALVAATLSALSWNYLFIPPRFTFHISEPEDTLLFLLYFLIALITGNLTARLRTQEQQARYNADRNLALYTLAHDMGSALTMDDILRTAVNQIGRIFAAEVAILLRTANGQVAPAHPASTLHLDEKEFAVATWVCLHGRSAGRFTDSLPSATARYLPLLASGKTVGVLGIRTRDRARLSAEQEALLETFANQTALVIQRELLDEATEQAAMLRESERLYTALLNSISHELRTPIATITGAASSLLDPHTESNAQARGELTHEIQQAAERLNRLVANLLDMLRLDAGRVQLRLEWCDVADVISVAVQRLEAALAQHPLTLNYQPHLPLVQMDFVLIEQVLVNLLDNACHYTPPATPIQISAFTRGNQLWISVADAGPGIPPADLERIFDKFYRAPGTATGGTGLGLAICRGLVEAHKGQISAENLPDGGARFTIRLPLGAQPPVQEATL